MLHIVGGRITCMLVVVAILLTELLLIYTWGELRMFESYVKLSNSTKIGPV